MNVSLRHRHPGIAALLLAAPLVAVTVFAGSRAGDEGGHAAAHLSLALPVLLLLLSARRWRQPAPGRLGRIARIVALAGLGILGGGQVMEAIGAFGFEGYDAQYAALTDLHDVAMVFAPIGLLFVLAGAILTGIARLQAARVSRWVVGASATVAMVLAGALLKVLLGA